MPPGDRRRRIVSTLVQRVLIIWTQFDKFKDGPARFFRGPARPRHAPAAAGMRLPVRVYLSPTAPRRGRRPARKRRSSRPGRDKFLRGPASRRPVLPERPHRMRHRAAYAACPAHRPGISRATDRPDRSLSRLSGVKAGTGMANSRDIHSGFSHSVRAKNHPMTVPDWRFPIANASRERACRPRAFEDADSPSPGRHAHRIFKGP